VTISFTLGDRPETAVDYRPWSASLNGGWTAVIITFRDDGAQACHDQGGRDVAWGG
jgi:hypothetical protein